jgi:hypothetical protein
MGKRRGRAHKMRDRNMLQAVAFGMVTLPRYTEELSGQAEIARQRLAVKHACMRAAIELGWQLRHSLHTNMFECWRPGMDIPWRGPGHLRDINVESEQWYLQQCCRLIVKKSLLNEEGT